MTAILPGAVWRQTDLLLGIVWEGHLSSRFPGDWEVLKGERRQNRPSAKRRSASSCSMYRLAMAAHANFLSKATINLSMQVRATWRRLHGLESHFVQEVLQLGKRKPDR